MKHLQTFESFINEAKETVFLISSDWGDTDTAFDEIRNAMSMMGFYTYDVPDFDGSDMHGLIVTKTKFVKSQKGEDLLKNPFLISADSGDTDTTFSETKKILKKLGLNTYDAPMFKDQDSHGLLVSTVKFKSPKEAEAAYMGT